MKKPTYIIGTSGWSYAEWRGIFYPKDLPTKDWLSYYQTQFNVVEINATFYRFFPKKVYEKWHDQAGKHFQYIIKVPRMITHFKRLKNCKSTIKQFCRSISNLDNKLGLILLQLPPNFSCHLDLLKSALLSFDDPKKVVVEFRNETWLIPETKKLLKEIGCIFCAIDSPEMKLLDWVTSPIAYIRLHGSTRWYDYKYTRPQLKKIAALAEKMAKQGAKKIYILFNNDYYSYGAENALALKEILEA